MIKFLIHNKVMKFFYALLLLPCCYSLFYTLIYVIKSIQLNNCLVQYFLLGVVGYLLLHFLLYKPIKLYVIGHELVHMLSAYLCGSTVKKVKITSSYGSVYVDKVNTFIALSPYFVPFYTIIVVFLWALVKYIVKINFSTEILSFFIGFTITFHLLLTIYAIYLGQQDFKISGWLFSIVVVFMINCLILIFLFVILFLPTSQIHQIKNFFVINTKYAYYFCYQIIVKFIKYTKIYLLQK
jgi:hypothetical protein